MERIEIIKGPAVIKKGLKVIYTEGDITVGAELTTSEGTNAVQAKYNEFHNTLQHVITFKPSAQVTQDYFDVLLPYHTPVLGASIYGAAPDDIVIWSVDGKQYTYKAGALTQMPNLAFAADMPLFDGDATFTAIGDCNEDWDTANHFTAYAEQIFNDATFDAAKDIRLHYAAAWGADPWDAIESEAGFKVSFDLQLEDSPTDSYGIADKTISGLNVSATFTPQGITPEQVTAALGIQGAGARRGRSMYGLARDLVLAGDLVGDAEFTMFKAALKGNSTQFGASVNRVGELTLTSLAGLNQQIFSIGLKAA